MARRHVKYATAAAVGTLFPAALVACTFLTDLGGLSGAGAPDAFAAFDGAADDVNQDPIEARSVDGATDSADASDSSDPRTTGCRGQPMHRFCDDFDESVLGALWTVRDERLGSLSLEDGGLSAPHVLVARGDAGAIGRRAYLKLEHPDASIQSVRCEFDARMDEFDPNGQTHVLALRLFSTAFTYYDVAVRVGQNPALLQEYGQFSDGGSTASTSTIGNITPGTWFHLKIDLKLTDPKTASVEIDGKAPLIKPLTLPSNSGWGAYFGLGQTDESTTPWTARFDNFWCDWQ